MTTATAMWALEGPSFTMDAGHLVLGMAGKVVTPIPCFLVQHERGLVLFDTGLVPEAAGDPVAFYGQERADHLGVRYEKRQRVDFQIAAAGFSTSDVTHVVLSHAHADHTGGLRFFPHTRIYAGAGELGHAYWPGPPQRHGYFRYTDLDPARDFDWREVDRDLDLFGDGSLRIVTLPGHTPGSIGLVVRLPSRSFVLTGDAVHLRCALDDCLPMGSDWNTQESVRSIRRLRELAEEHRARVWIGHDPQDWEELTAEGREFR